MMRMLFIINVAVLGVILALFLRMQWQGQQFVTKSIVSRSLQLVDDQGTTRLAATGGNSATPAFLMLAEPSGGERFIATIDQSGNAEIVINDNTGRPRWRMTVNADGTAHLDLHQVRQSQAIPFLPSPR